jgi:outer membrane protein assembly factor BamB
MKFQSAFVLLASALAMSACGGGGEPAPSSFPGLSIDGGNAYLASNMLVHKFEASSGKEAWRYPAAPDANNPRGPFAGEPLKFNDLIIVGGTVAQNGAADARVYALSDANGSEQWRWSVPSASEKDRREFADGIVTDGKLLFAANGNGALYALDPSGGSPKLAWEYKTGNKLWAKPLVANGKVFQPSLDHTLYALDAATGKEIWKFPAGASIASTPAIKDGILYFGSFDSKFYAVNAETGAKVWESVVDAWIWNEALVEGDIVYVGDAKGKAYAINARDGSRKWATQLGGTIRAKPVLGGENVFFLSTDTYVYSVATSNGAAKRLLESGLTRRLIANPLVVNNTLLVPLFDGDVKLSAISLESGGKKFELNAATPIAR